MRSGAAKVRHLAGEEIDDPGAQFGTDSSTGDVFSTRCRALPANTISTRFNLHLNLAKSLRSAGQIVRLPHPVSSTDRPIDFGSARSPLLCSCSAARRGVSPASMSSYQHLPIRQARGQRIRRSSGACGCSKDRCVELLTHPRPREADEPVLAEIELKRHKALVQQQNRLSAASSAEMQVEPHRPKQDSATAPVKHI
jgi:hypothetical protein